MIVVTMVVKHIVQTAREDVSLSQSLGLHRSGQGTEQVKTEEVQSNHFAWTLSWALLWTPSWDISWELSWGVLEGL